MFENKDQGPKRTEYGIVQLVYTVYYIPYIHSVQETIHETQSFYTNVELHATYESEDKCPKQRLDYDRTNLLKNHEPQAKFIAHLPALKLSWKSVTL